MLRGGPDTHAVRCAAAVFTANLTRARMSAIDFAKSAEYTHIYPAHDVTDKVSVALCSPKIVATENQPAAMEDRLRGAGRHQGGGAGLCQGPGDHRRPGPVLLHL